MEKWSRGVMGKKRKKDLVVEIQYSNTPLLQYSSAPVLSSFHYSITPVLQHSNLLGRFYE
jgi:hypothetical protein